MDATAAHHWGAAAAQQAQEDKESENLPHVFSTLGKREQARVVLACTSNTRVPQPVADESNDDDNDDESDEHSGGVPTGVASRHRHRVIEVLTGRLSGVDNSTNGLRNHCRSGWL